MVHTELVKCFLQDRRGRASDHAADILPDIVGCHHGRVAEQIDLLKLVGFTKCFFELLHRGIDRRHLARNRVPVIADCKRDIVYLCQEGIHRRHDVLDRSVLFILIDIALSQEIGFQLDGSGIEVTRRIAGIRIINRRGDCRVIGDRIRDGLVRIRISNTVSIWNAIKYNIVCRIAFERRSCRHRSIILLIMIALDILWFLIIGFGR